MAVGDEACDQIDQKVDRTAMTGMFDLTDVFELIVDGLDDGAFAKKELVRPLEQAVVHLCAQCGDELKPLGHQELLSEWLRERALITKEFANQACGELRNRVSIIDVTWRQAEHQDLALIVDDQVQLEAIKPADRCLAACGTSIKHPVLVNARITADGKRGGVYEADAGATPQLGMQIGQQRDKHGGHQLDKALIAHQCWKLAAQMALHIFSVIGFERAIMGLLEQDDNGHDLTCMQLGWTY